MVSQEAVHPHGYVKSGHDGHAGGTIQSYSASLALKSAEDVRNRADSKMALLPGETKLAEPFRMGRGCCGWKPIHIVMMTDRRMVLKFEHGVWCVSEGWETSIMYKCAHRFVCTHKT